MKVDDSLNSLGLYIHIPFCVKKCNYCDFYSIEYDFDTVNHYVSDVIDALKYWKEHLSSDRIIDTIYFGGGTPSVLGDVLLSKLITSISDLFVLSDNSEITIEVNPNSILELNLKSLKKSGVNRISMGLQSSNDNELKILGRSHTSAEALKAVEHIHKAGISNFSLDVMTGIPLQTYDSLDKTLDWCIDSDATHISTYMLKIEENTPFYKNKDKYTFAGEDAQADFYEFTCKKLISNNFRHYEISNFCRNDLISRHNNKYWHLDDYLGIGPSAHSMIDGKRFYYPRNINVFTPDNIVYESEGKTAEEYIMLSLRTDAGFNYKEYSDYFGITPSKEFHNEVLTLSKAGLLITEDDSFHLTDRGYLVSNAIISRLLDAENM